MTPDEKMRENRLRRLVARQGLQLRKSRRRDPNAMDFGAYWIVDPFYNVLVFGDGHGVSLDAIEVWVLNARISA